MKLAICFYGQSRNIRNPCVAASYLKLKEKYDVDFYCHSWKYNDGESLNVSAWVPATCQSHDAENFILETYAPIAYRFDPPLNASLSERSVERAKRMSDYSPSNEKCLLSHLKSITECARLVTQPEKYDFILISRYDVHLYRLPELHTLQKKFYITDKHNKWWCDSCQLFSSNFLKAFDIYDNAESLLCDISNSSTPWFVAELFKKFNYQRSFDMSDVIHTIDLWTGIVRNENGLENVLI